MTYRLLFAAIPVEWRGNGNMGPMRNSVNMQVTQLYKDLSDRMDSLGLCVVGLVNRVSQECY